MRERLPIEELSRQPLVVGTTCFTDPTGNEGFKTEQVQVSALVRIAAALEAQNELAQTKMRACFTPEEKQDGLNHLRASWVRGTNVVMVDFLATSPHMAETFIANLNEVLKAAIAQAEQQEGGEGK